AVGIAVAGSGEGDAAVDRTRVDDRLPAGDDVNPTADRARRRIGDGVAARGDIEARSGAFYRPIVGNYVIPRNILDSQYVPRHGTIIYGCFTGRGHLDATKAKNSTAWFVVEMVVGILEYHTVTISYNRAIVIDEGTLTALCDNPVSKLR